MSDTIQSRHSSARQAMLLQQRPSALIEAAESGTHQSVLLHQPTKFYGGGKAGVYIVGTGAIGSTMSKVITGAGPVVVLAAVDWSTSGGELAIDTNDYSADAWQRWAEVSKAALTKTELDPKLAPSAAARLRVQRLTALQASFGLPVSELAQVLGISRQWLYKWLDESNDLKVQGANLDRLACVERIAKQWREASAAPLSSVAREPLENGGTVLGLLTAENLDEAAVTGAFGQLVAKLQAKPKSRSQKLTAAGFTRRPSARALPADE